MIKPFLAKKCFISKIMLSVLFVVIGIAIASLLMLGVYSLPTDNMIRHAEQSKEMFAGEEFDYWNGDYECSRYSRIDNYTDAIMLMTALSNPYSKTSENAFLNPTIRKDIAESPQWNLVNLIDDGEGEPYNYARYWHGYLVFLKPLLLFFNISDIKEISLFAQFLLIAAVLIELWKKNRVFPMLFSVVVLFINPISTSICLQFVDIMCITLMTMFVVLRGKSKEHFVVFLFNGMAVAFFDFLTYPVVALGLPLITVLMINECSVKESFTEVFGDSIAWVIGYGGLWAGKWLIAYLFTGVDVFEESMNSIAIRTWSDSCLTFGSVLSTNMQIVMNRPYYLLTILAIAILLIFAWRSLNDKTESDYLKVNAIPAIILVGLFPLIWYSVLQNHAAVHPFMEYRQLSVSVWSVLVIIVRLINAATHSKKEEKLFDEF